MPLVAKCDSRLLRSALDMFSSWSKLWISSESNSFASRASTPGTFDQSVRGPSYPGTANDSLLSVDPCVDGATLTLGWEDPAKLEPTTPAVAAAEPTAVTAPIWPLPLDELAPAAVLVDLDPARAVPPGRFRSCRCFVSRRNSLRADLRRPMYARNHVS